METRHNKLREQHSKLSLEDRLEAEFAAEMATLDKSADDLVAEVEKGGAEKKRRRRSGSRRALAL